MGWEHGLASETSLCKHGTFKENIQFWYWQRRKENIYILYIRSILEQSCVVWHSSLTDENGQSLERVQKAAMKVILGQQYTNYEEALEKLDLQPLSERREELCLKFAKKCLRNNKVKDMFPLSEKPHQMDLQNTEKYVVKPC